MGILETGLPNGASYTFRNIGYVPINDLHVKYACIGYSDRLPTNDKCPPAIIETEYYNKAVKGVIGPSDYVSIQLKLKNDINDIYKMYRLFYDDNKVHLYTILAIEYSDPWAKRELSFCNSLQKDTWQNCPNFDINDYRNQFK